jgi:hypothetical protein
MGSAGCGLGAHPGGLEGHALALAGEYDRVPAEGGGGCGPAGPAVRLDVLHADADQDGLSRQAGLGGGAARWQGVFAVEGSVDA